MRFGFFGKKSTERAKGPFRRQGLHRRFEQLEDRRLLANTAPDLAAVAPVTASPGTEVTVQLNVSDAAGETPAAELFVFLDPDEAPVGATIDNATRILHWTVPANQPLNQPVRIVAIVTDKPFDGSPALADAEEIIVNIAAANQPPVNTVPGAQTVAEDTDLVFSTANNNLITVADPDAGTEDLEVTLAVTNGDLTLGATTGLSFTAGDGTDDATMTFTGSITDINAALAGLRFSPAANSFGTTTLTITTNDQGNTGVGGEKTDTDTVSITVTPIADTPSVTHATTQEDTQTTSDLVVTRNPADTEEVTFIKITEITHGTLFLHDGTTMVQNGNFIPFEQAAAGLRFTPAANFNGTASFQIQASTSSTDAGLGGGLVPALITVFPVNDAPDLASITDKSVRRGEELMFTATATDIDTDDVLTFSIDPDLAALGATIDPATGVFRWTPSASQPAGPVTVRILATDNGTPALADSETFTVTVIPENQAPVVNAIADQTIAEGSQLSVTVTATDPDEGDVLTFSLAPGQFPEGATIDAESGVFRWTPTEAQGPGTHSVTVVATDNRTPNMSGSQTFMVTVTEVNEPPVLTPIGNRTGIVGAPVTFTAQATDPDAPANNLTFTLQGAPAGATINPQTGAFAWTPTAAGTVTFMVIVADNANPASTDQEEITITVAAANQAPVLNEIAAQSGVVGTAITFDANANDPDGDNLTYTLGTGAPQGASIDPATGVFTWTPDAAGTFTVTVIVTDDGEPAGFDSQEVTITVSTPNQAPVLAEIPAQSGTVGAPVTFTAAATDANGDTLTYSLDNRAPSGATINPTTGAFTWTPTAAGPVTFGVVVTDNGNPALSDTQDVTVTVTQPNQAPVLTDIPAQTGSIGTPVTFTAMANDPDGNGLTYSLDARAPQGATINAQTGAFSWTPTAEGPVTFGVVATDDGNPPQFDLIDVTITVGPSGG